MNEEKVGKRNQGTKAAGTWKSSFFNKEPIKKSSDIATRVPRPWGIEILSFLIEEQLKNHPRSRPGPQGRWDTEILLEEQDKKHKFDLQKCCK